MQSSDIKVDIKALETQQLTAQENYRQAEFEGDVEEMGRYNKEIYRIQGEIIALQDILNDKTS